MVDADTQTEGVRKRRESDINRDTAEVKAAKAKAAQLEAIHSRTKQLALERKTAEEEVGAHL